MGIKQEFEAYRAVASEQRLLGRDLKGLVGRTLNLAGAEFVTPFFYIFERMILGTQSQEIIDETKELERAIDLSRKVKSNPRARECENKRN